MPDLWMDVDTALAEVPVNVMPLLDDTDFKTREVAIAFNAAGMDLVWNFVTTAGAFTQTAVTPTTAGDYDWTHQGDGMYTIEIPASGGISINNDTEGFGWFTGFVTGVLPWRGPTIGFRAAALNNSMVDGATIDVNVTAMAAGVVTAAAIATGAIDADAIADNAIDAGAIAADAITAAKIADGAIDAATFAAGAITAAAIAADAIGASELAADAVAEIADAVWDEDATAHQTQGTFGQAIGDPGVDTDTIWALANTNLDAMVSSRASQTSVNTIDDFLDTEIASIISTLGTPAGVSLAADIAAIEAQTDDIGAAGAGLTAVPWNAAWDAEVQSEVDDALVARNLDKLVIVSGTADSGSTSTMVDAARTEGDNDYWKGRIILFTSGNISGQAAIITDFVAGTDTFTFAPPVTQAVSTQNYVILPAISAWDDTLAEHLISGSTGAALNAAGSAGDPWSTALPGAYGPGTAGKIVGDNVNATISSRATQTSVDTIDDFLDTEIAAIKAQTDQLTFTTANKVDATIQAAGDFAQAAADKVWLTASRTLTAFGFSVTVGTNSDKTGYTLSAAGIQAIWDALTSALTTVGSIGKLLVDNINATISSRSSHSAADVWSVATRVLTAGTNIVLAKGTGVTGFNDLSAAQVNAEADTALSDVGLTTTVTGRIDAAISTRATPAQVNAEVVDAWAVDTYTEPGQEAPPATTTLAVRLRYLYKAFRNPFTQTATDFKLYDDAGAVVDQKATVSDDGTTFTRGKIGTGP